MGKNESPTIHAYDIPSKAVEGSKWNMGLKLENKSMTASAKQLGPGPGKYNPDFNSNVTKYPEFSMKGRYKEVRKLNVPGPGHYEKTFVVHQKSPNYGFGSSPQREKMKPTLSPGPGAYKV